MLHLDELGALAAERIDNAVAEHLRVVRRVVKVAAIREEAFALAVGPDPPSVLPDRLVSPVPDASADDRVAGIERVDVRVEASGRVADRVCVFAEEVRLFVVLAALENALRRRIHVAVDVAVGAVALVVDDRLRIKRVKRIRRGLHVLAGARLVSERPEEDAGMVLVVLEVVDVALDVRLAPLRLARKRLVAEAGSVRLDVRLGNDVDSVLVAEIVPEMVVGIVARADHVDVVALEEKDVLQHLRTRDGVTSVWRRLVAVHALHLHRDAVEKNLAVLHLDAPDARLHSALIRRSVVVLLLDDEPVQVRRLCGPELRRIEVRRQCGSHVRSVRRHRHGLRREGNDLLAVRVVYRRRHLRRADLSAVRAACDGDRRLRGLEVVRDIVVYAEIAKLGLRHGVERDVAVDAAEAPRILVLHVRAVRPAVRLDGDRVFTGLQVLRDVELGGEAAVLAVADLLSVDPEVESAEHAVESDEHLASLPCSWSGELLEIL